MAIVVQLPKVGVVPVHEAAGDSPIEHILQQDGFAL